MQLIQYVGHHKSDIMWLICFHFDINKQMPIMQLDINSSQFNMSAVIKPQIAKKIQHSTL